ncbi:hypothetical protein PENANT_c006G08973 [Penicillium antarcticum]|uniref:Zn(2)-C6 fungal-type domain-containing protein n=1 Tax=Penicillium antarcticum TaxID=416450 RepID=A0A1V6QE10_9EURO|nr:hypothetical protein PENANT_c006G08973 [Penicillium antarcticum]
MDNFNELPVTEKPTGESFCNEASISEACPSGATVEESSTHGVPTNVLINDVCTNDLPTSDNSLGDACTSKMPTKDVSTSGIPTSDSPTNDMTVIEPVANETSGAPGEIITPEKKRRGRHDPEPDWSAQMRDKVKKSHSRIGQACDRCKVKKMRCTPDHNGCASCISHNVPCRVTDRVTGQTYVRGEAERMRVMINRLSKQADTLQREVAVLQQENELLRESHVELKKRVNMYKSSLDTYGAGFVLSKQEADMMHLL